MLEFQRTEAGFNPQLKVDTVDVTKSSKMLDAVCCKLHTIVVVCLHEPVGEELRKEKRVGAGKYVFDGVEYELTYDTILPYVNLIATVRGAVGKAGALKKGARSVGGPREQEDDAERQPPHCRPGARRGV